MRKNPLIPVILLLFLIISLFEFYSFSGFNLSLFGVEIKKSNSYIFPDNFQFFAETKNTALGDGPEQPNEEINPPKEIKKSIDSSSQRILLIGDSMAEGLMYRFRDYCEANKHKLFPVVWYSSNTKAFSDNNKLEDFIKKFEASYVILVLGANELFVKDLENRDKYIKNIIRQAKDVNLVWVGPPNWKKDTGINDLILKNIGKQRYFPSKDLTFNRISDGAHPTKKSSDMWADKISEWIMNESYAPIVLTTPKETYKTKINAVMMNYANK